MDRARPVPRWLSLVGASRNRQHPPRKRNGRTLPRRVAGSNPARGSNPKVARRNSCAPVFKKSLDIEDFETEMGNYTLQEVKVTPSKSSEIPNSCDDRHDCPAESIDTKLDPGFSYRVRWIGLCSNITNGNTASHHHANLSYIQRCCNCRYERNEFAVDNQECHNHIYHRRLENL